MFLSRSQVKDNKISIVIEAESLTVYKLETELIRGNEHNININETLY